MTFFSGTDTSTLQKEGSDQNHFVSLIVNNECKYTAGITRKIEKTIKGEIFSSYKSFANLLIPGLIKPIEKIEETIEWFELQVEIEDDPIKEEINIRLEEIKVEKQKVLNNTSETQTFKNHNIQAYDEEPKEWQNDWAKSWHLNKTYSLSDSVNRHKQLDIPFEDVPICNFKKSIEPLVPPGEIPYGTVFFNKAVLNLTLLQLLSGSVVISNRSKINVDNWVKIMPTVFKERFGSGKNGDEKFGYWADSYINFLLQYAENDDLIIQFDEEEVQAIFAYDLIQELEKLEQNQYIKEFIKILETYII